MFSVFGPSKVEYLIVFLFQLKIFESAHAHEVKLRIEAEEALRTTVNEQEKLVEEKEELARELQNTLGNIALLDSHAREVNSRCDEAARELKLIQASIATLQQEKQKIRREKMEAVRWLERWRSRGDDGTANCDGFMGLVEDLPGLAEFSLADLQTATCNFSDSFKIGKGGHGCVYKGEMLGRTVAIKKLYPTSMQGQSEFQQEVSLSLLSFPPPKPSLILVTVGVYCMRLQICKGCFRHSQNSRLLNINIKQHWPKFNSSFNILIALEGAT